MQNERIATVTPIHKGITPEPAKRDWKTVKYAVAGLAFFCAGMAVQYIVSSPTEESMIEEEELHHRIEACRQEYSTLEKKGRALKDHVRDCHGKMAKLQTAYDDLAEGETRISVEYSKQNSRLAGLVSEKNEILKCIDEDKVGKLLARYCLQKASEK
ncbi:hypothetical protein HZB00_03030 [Candidatus Woesearchaeota archaeon]|nr:hypothetical protein [Candidatus Woesearchaeota archaeon]